MKAPYRGTPKVTNMALKCWRLNGLRYCDPLGTGLVADPVIRARYDAGAVVLGQPDFKRMQPRRRGLTG